MTSATDESVDLSQFEGKRVKLVRNLSEQNDKGESAVEIEGQVQVANEMGMLIKPKGLLRIELIPIEEIEPESVHLVEDKAVSIKRSKVKPVKTGQARRHLLDRHGYTLAWVNGVTEEQAMEHHEGIDHEAQDLGHLHVAVDEKKNDSSDESESESDEE